jgi:hypothetical protein
MGTLMAVLVTLAFCSCVSLLVVRSVIRVIRRRLAGLRDAATLRARAHGVGTAAEVARLRREIERSLGGARRALAAARALDAPVGDVRSLLGRLELAGRAVDAELQVLEAQPDRTRQAAGLTAVRVRAELVIRSAAELVDGLLHGAGHRDDELTLLHAACALEAEALRSSRPAARRDLTTR